MEITRIIVGFLILHLLIFCDSTKDCGCSATNRENKAKVEKSQDSLNSCDSSIVESSEEHTRTNQMTFIKGGSFIMGERKPFIPADGEGPIRKVHLSSFYLDVHEVSNNEFAKFVNEMAYITEAEKFGNSFVLEGFISDKIKENIKQAVCTFQDELYHSTIYSLFFCRLLLPLGGCQLRKQIGGIRKDQIHQ